MSVLLYTAPLFAAVGLAIKLPEERLSVIQWGGVLLAFLGIGAAFLLPALMSHSPAAEGSELWWWGDILGLCSGISWGFTIIVMRVTTVSEAAPTQMLFGSWRAALCCFFPVRCSPGRTISKERRSAGRVCFSDLYRVFRKLSRLVPADQNLLGSSFGDSGLYDADFRRHPFGAFLLGESVGLPLRGGFFDGVLRHHGGAASAFFSAPPILMSCRRTVRIRPLA